MNACMLCPRACGVDRSKLAGFCKMPDDLYISRVGLHEWEEPCISFGKGSGTIFFAGCNMKCVYCQNYEISDFCKGKKVSVDKLCDEMLRLCQMGACNINFVTPTHYADKIVMALDKVKHKLNIPVVYNTSGYESVNTLKALDGYIDIYLPDVKYYSPCLSEKYSACRDYFDVAVSAVREMVRQTGKINIDDDGRMLRGTLVRHMVLPSHYNDSLCVFDNLVKEINPLDVAVSVMCQYFPTHKAKDFPELSRRVTSLEYMRVVNHVKELGFGAGFMQHKNSADSKFVPEFDYR